MSAIPSWAEAFEIPIGGCRYLSVPNFDYAANNIDMVKLRETKGTVLMDVDRH